MERKTCFTIYPSNLTFVAAIFLIIYIMYQHIMMLIFIALSKTLPSSTLNTEVERGDGKSGVIKFKKNNFSGIKSSATPNAISNVAESIKLVFAKGTRETFISDILLVVVH